MEKKLEIKIKKLSENAVIPKYAKEGDAGMDLTAISSKLVSKDGYTYLEYGTGLAIEIPDGHFGLLRPRSSISKTNLIFSTSGVIDSGYRGELLVRFKIENGDGIDNVIPSLGERIAQITILPYPKVKFVETDELSQSERGEGGYGHTGK